MSANPPTPRRGEIWRVHFDPTIGAEIQKTRPAIVISSDAVGRLPIKLVAPITDWKDYYAANIWHVRIVTQMQIIVCRKCLLLMHYNYVAWIISDSFAS